MDIFKTSFVKIAEILSGNHTGKFVSVRGWVHRQRSSGGMAFVVVRDSSGIIQCTVKKDVVGDEKFSKASGVFVESSVMLSGTVREDRRAPGGFEISAADFGVIGLGEPFPIAKDQSTEFLLDTRHLWIRSQRLTNIMKVRDYITRYLRQFFFDNGFYELAPPIITGAACEGGATLFKLSYFNQPAYLTQSSQLYGEVFTTSLENIFVLAPSFRQEPSRTVRHLAEYWHLEPEMAFYNQEMNMELQEKMIEFVCRKMTTEHTQLLQDIGRNAEDLAKVKVPFPRLAYDEALKKLAELGKPLEWGQDLGADEEAALTASFDKPIFVTNYPKAIKAFYMREDPDKPGTVLNADMLAPSGHGEIIGGSERIWQYDELMSRIKDQNLKEEDYYWYIDLRKYGPVPHAGFGLGIERLVKWILNLEHIRDAIPFPRVINRVRP